MLRTSWPYCALIVDTENYAGNFEREMCAYATGQIGDCGVGRRQAGAAKEELRHLAWWNEHIVQVPDDHGTRRPASIWPTPGWFNSGMGRHYRNTPEENVRALREFAAQVSAARSVDPKALPDIAADKLTQWSAYLSVAVFVDEMPPLEVWSEFQQRVQDFAREHKQYGGAPDPLTVTGFRQLTPDEIFRPQS